MEIAHAQIKYNAQQAITRKVFRQYYLSVLLHGSDQEIIDELGPDILDIHKKTIALNKAHLEKRREERSKEMAERRAQREEKRQMANIERFQHLAEKRAAREKDLSALKSTRTFPGFPISALSLAIDAIEEEDEAPVEEDEEGISDEE